MKLLFVLENYLPHIGGVEIVFKNLAESLVEQGHEINLVTHRLKNTQKFEIINGVKVHRINCLQSRYLFSALAIPKILQLAQTADLIHTTTFNGAPPSWLVGKITGKKVLLTVHEVWIDKWSHVTDFSKLSCFLHNLLEKAIYALKYDHYACVSHATKNDLLKIGISEKKVSTIYNGIDYELWDPQKYDQKSTELRKKLGLEKQFVYLFYGRPGASKGLEYLLKAVPIITQQIPHSKLLALVSQDKAYQKRYDYILKLIETEKIKDKIILLDPVPYAELPAYVNAADCVVIPSITEGFGFNAVEAAALGKPVVASNTTSLPEVVSGKFMLVKPKNPQDLALGIRNIFQGKYQQTKTKQFIAKDNLNKYLEIYQSLLKSENHYDN